MERWRGKVAVVTGASAGIGVAVAKQLVSHGLIVIGLARRIDMMKEEMKDVEGPGEFHAKECDVTNEQNVIEIFAWIKDTFSSLNIIINNAGVLKVNKIEDSATKDLENVFKVNVFGLLYCTKHAIKLMKENETEAHIINVNSIAGHRVHQLPNASVNVYPASKHAVTALSETLKYELMGTKIRVSNISPGAVKTAMFADVERNITLFKGSPALEAEDVSNSIMHALSAPPNVEIDEITLTAKYM